MKKYRKAKNIPMKHLQSDCCSAPIKPDPSIWLCSKCRRITNPVKK